MTLTFGLLSPSVPGCRLGLPAALLSLLWVNTGKRRNGNIMTRSAETKVLLACITLWALTHNCKGLWEIGTFYCFCSNHLFIYPPFSPSCPYSYFVFHSSHLPSFLFHFLLFLPVLLVSHPSLTPYLNHFPFPLLSVSLSSLHLSLSPPHPHRHPSLPILIALPTGGHSQARLPAGCIVSTSFIVRSVYKKRTEQ